MGDLIQTIDQASVPFLVWLQGFQSDGLTSVMRFFSYLGTEYFFILLLPFLYWTISKRWGAMVAFALTFLTSIFGILGFVEVVIIHPDAQSALAFVVIPVWQWVILMVGTGLVYLLKKK